MKSSDRAYLQGVLDSFILAAINRVSHSGDMEHLFRLDAVELKQATDRQRLHETVVDDVLGFFYGARVEIKYDQGRASFDIYLDLSRCALNQGQSSALATAMEMFRAEHN
ncbi:hypothetical protein MXC99_05515 [Thauera aromatica]|uniref:hypothetical protein n=1 Tax=Thauera aromatica TaxID=59405 RepID=UPI001FFC5E8A|nr:hypothetical protein [Thauera aromatica]MCK2087632.1 hypothetical protein [Thauera aromatica]